MRVLIVDDSAFMRKVIKGIVEREPTLEVVGLARDGEHAVTLAKQLKPDLITLDIEMPHKDGIEALREIRVACTDPSPSVLMCSSLTVAGSTDALRALKAGAADVIAKNPDTVGRGDEAFAAELIAKLTALGEHKKRLNRPALGPIAAPDCPEPAPGADLPSTSDDIELVCEPEIIVIGSSTGGPPVLERLIGALPASLSVPVIVAQHMPAVFTRSLASRLDDQSACRVQLAHKGVTLEPGTVYIAEGGHHLHLTRIPSGRTVARYTEDHPGTLFKPSVDLLFESVAALFGGAVLGVVLTGMGEDGARGAGAIHARGGRVVAQSERSCVVYGMPHAVVLGGHADGLMDPDEIARLVCRAGGVRTRRRTA